MWIRQTVFQSYDLMGCVLLWLCEVYFWSGRHAGACHFSSLYFKHPHATIQGGRGGTWSQNSFCSWAEPLLVPRSCKHHRAGDGSGVVASCLSSCCWAQGWSCSQQQALALVGDRDLVPGTSGDSALLPASAPGSRDGVPTCIRGSSCKLLPTLPCSVAAPHFSHDLRSCFQLPKPSRSQSSGFAQGWEFNPPLFC